MNDRPFSLLERLDAKLALAGTVDYRAPPTKTQKDPKNKQ